jgi:hypothetical protein
MQVVGGGGDISKIRRNKKTDAATQPWILQWLHHKTDLVLKDFGFIRNPILIYK